MRAIVYDRYGPPEVLRFDEVERPAPQNDKVLIKIHATSVSRTDCATRDGNRHSGLAAQIISRCVSGIGRPRRRILGTELAGEVVAVGGAVTEFASGDYVFGRTGFRFGGYAEYICMRESDQLAHKPAGMSFEEAAGVSDGAYYALSCLRAALPLQGRRMLIYGASGAIGTAAVQLAKYFQAEVTAVCSTKNLELMGSIGADSVIDYSRQDFTENGESYDVIFDAVGKRSFKRCKKSLTRGGIYLATDGFDNLRYQLWPPLAGGRRVVLFGMQPRNPKRDVTLFLKELIDSGRYTPVIDRVYPWEEVVDATRYVETEQKTGNVILIVNQS